ncbi:unnamed protein product [marine sediment metagenome]|uniref:Biopolymer transport protein ExbD/TolR n=1 Tax=marine sediment metagenome TaxID=412755 RepID=X0TMQ0_9ZZZZ
MRVRHLQRRGEEQVELQMTPMIDIVFQLLVFFIMTFQIISPEGDFNIKMPLAAPTAGLPDDTLPPITVRLRAGIGGELAGIYLNERPKMQGGFAELREQILAIVGEDIGPGSLAESTEVELDCDYNLRFEFLVDAITAVSGYVQDGRIIKVIERIRLSPPRSEGSEGGSQ